MCHQCSERPETLGCSLLVRKGCCHLPQLDGHFLETENLMRVKIILLLFPLMLISAKFMYKNTPPPPKKSTKKTNKPKNKQKQKKEHYPKGHHDAHKKKKEY